MIEIREDDPTGGDVADLMARHIREARATAPPENRHVMEPAALADPRIVFWTARIDGAVAGMVALKELSPDHGEIKSMRTAPEHLRKGVGRALLEHALAVARARGFARVSLETGTHPHFDAANVLYERVGFVDGPVFGGYPESEHNRFMTLSL